MVDRPSNAAAADIGGSGKRLGSGGLGENALIVLLACLVGIGPISTSLYVPSLPDLPAAFATTAGHVQLTLSIYLVAFAVVQLVYGPLSDAIGRRRALALGFVIYAAGSFACAAALTIDQLIAARLIQAVGACAGPVVARAVVREAFGAQRAVPVMATIAAALAVAPAVGPILGGHLHVWFGWRSNFILLGLIGAALLWMIWHHLPETNASRNRDALNPRVILRNYARLMGSRPFRRYAATAALTYSGMFGYVTGSPFLLITKLGVSTEMYGYLILFNVVGYLGGSLLSRRLEPRIGIDRTLVAGGIASSAAGLFFLSQAWGDALTVVSTVISFAVFQLGVGLALANGSMGAIRAFPQFAGAASALVGFFQMAGSALASFLVARFNGSDQLVMGLILAGCALATLWIAGLLTAAGTGSKPLETTS